MKLRIGIRLVKRKEPIKEVVELGKTVENLKVEVFKSFRIPQLVEWLSKQLKKRS